MAKQLTIFTGSSSDLNSKSSIYDGESDEPLASTKIRQNKARTTSESSSGSQKRLSISGKDGYNSQKRSSISGKDGLNTGRRKSTKIGFTDQSSLGPVSRERTMTPDNYDDIPIPMSPSLFNAKKKEFLLKVMFKLSNRLLSRGYKY